jgi:hypothetical protein
MVSWSSEHSSDSAGEGGLTLNRTETPLPRSIAVSAADVVEVQSSEVKDFVPIKRVEISESGWR